VEGHDNKNIWRFSPDLPPLKFDPAPTASEIAYIVSGGVLNSTHSLAETTLGYFSHCRWRLFGRTIWQRCLHHRG